MIPTIVAESSPAGHGAISLVRLSGEQAVEIVVSLFEKTAPGPLKKRFAHFGTLTDGSTIIDDVVVTWFPKPHSFTGEDVVEIGCHGNPLIVRQLIELCIQKGAEQAQPGAFSLRGFLNGKFDLAQAEAIANLIHANSKRALTLAHDQSRKMLSTRISEIAATLRRHLVLIEAHIDFPEEQLPSHQQDLLAADIDGLIVFLERMIASYDDGKRFQEGIKLVILGKPNVGKSSLLNNLLGDDHAIVSATAGTTRDIIGIDCRIRDIPVRLIDTAGIHRSANDIEQEGIKRALAAQRDADLILIVTTVDDASMPSELQDVSATVLDVVNKCDKSYSSEADLPGDGTHISVIEKWGIEALKDRIYGALVSERFEQNDLVLVNERHQRNCRHCCSCLVNLRRLVETCTEFDIMAFECRQALTALEEITGVVTSDDILHDIFAQFCIGK